MRTKNSFLCVMALTGFLLLFLSRDAGAVSAVASIGDRVWEDTNPNGTQDAGESGIANVEVSLTDCSGNPVNDIYGNHVVPTFTDANGNYNFTNLAPGQYQVTFDEATLPAGYVWTVRDAGAEDVDSDADQATGRSDCRSLVAGQTDNDVDAGAFFGGQPAGLGDFVWYDINRNGIQDEGEPGVEGVTVSLLDCSGNPIRDNNGDPVTTVTGAAGYYAFKDLIPGQNRYKVRFLLPSGYLFTAQKAGDDALDSDPDSMGQTDCISLALGQFDPNWDAGIYNPGCPLVVKKTCTVLPPPTGVFTCTKPIDSISMIWSGTINGQSYNSAIRIKAWKGTVGSTLLATIDNIQPGDEVTVSGYAGSPNDVYWEIFDATTGSWLGDSTFHVSCSDDDMDGPEDCGKAEGDGKGQTGYLNDWILEGMVDAAGSFDCTAAGSGESDSCAIEAPRPPHCLTKVKSLYLRYVGDSCVYSDNDQAADKWSCSGDGVTGETVRLRITDGGSKTYLDQIGVVDGDVVLASAGDREFGSNTVFEIYAGGSLVQSGNFHTSCSQPLNLLDQFGGLEIVGIDLKDLGLVSIGGEVVYSYEIINTGTESVYVDSVDDDKLGMIVPTDIYPAFTLEPNGVPGDHKTIPVPTFVFDTVTNTVTVTGHVSGETGPLCVVQDHATVTAVGPPLPECLVSGDEYMNVGDNKFEWKLFNHSHYDTVTIDQVTLAWPENLGRLKKIKLERDTIFEQYVDWAGEGNTITIDAWINNLSKRQIKPGDDRKLVVEFETKYKATAYEFSVSVGFDEGCTVIFKPDCVVSGDALLKISDNKIEWEMFNQGSNKVTLESLEIGWPEGLGSIKKIKVNADTVFEQLVPAPDPGDTVKIDTWINDRSKRQINPGDNRKLVVEFSGKYLAIAEDFAITARFEACSATYVPGQMPFTCTKPINELTMIWNGAQPIRIKAWKGTVAGSELLVDLYDRPVLNPGDEVTVSGYAGSPNDVYWELYAVDSLGQSTTKLGESTFHLSCSDIDMNGSQDCGKPQGDGKDRSGFINQWLLEGMVDAAGSFDCTNP